jgi:hypothetical protein
VIAAAGAQSGTGMLILHAFRIGKRARKVIVKESCVGQSAKLWVKASAMLLDTSQ